jgi:hypothetical protein
VAAAIIPYHRIWINPRSIATGSGNHKRSFVLSSCRLYLIKAEEKLLFSGGRLPGVSVILTGQNVEICGKQGTSCTSRRRINMQADAAKPNPEEFDEFFSEKPQEV